MWPSKETALFITGLGLGIMMTITIEVIIAWTTLGHAIID